MVFNILENSHVVITAKSQGGRYCVKIKADNETVEKFSVAVKRALEGGDWERGKIMITTERPVYTGEVCDENNRRADVFSEIYGQFLAEKRHGKSRGFAEFVRGLMREYEAERGKS